MNKRKIIVKYLIYLKNELILTETTKVTTVLEIVLLRHPETQWNRDKLIQGHTDIPPLDPTVPDSLVDALAALGDVVSVYSSDLQRCSLPAFDLYRKLVKNAEADKERNEFPWPIPFVQTRYLRERSFGVLEGKSYHALGVDDVRSVGELFYCRGEIEAGESVHDALGRASVISDEILHPKGCIKKGVIPVVTHGCFLNYLITAFEQCHQFDPSNLSVYRAAGNLSGFRVQIDNFHGYQVREIAQFPEAKP